ncbi:MAG: hypothetical protein AAF151_21835 [Cyanobacteria bacterium J06656_5]
MSEYPETLRAISIINPFAWEICTGQKPLEFRSWDTQHRGLTLIHTSSSRKFEGDFAEFYPEVTKATIASMRGAIIGFATVTDSVWREEDNAFGHRMMHPALFPKPIPCSGALNYWKPQGKQQEQQSIAFQAAWNAIQAEEFEKPHPDVIASCELDYDLELSELL